MMHGRSSRLRGRLKMIASSQNFSLELERFPFDESLMKDGDMALRNRRKRRIFHGNRGDASATTVSFESIVSEHRYVCFIVVQSSQDSYYSKHTLDLRRRLAEHYQDSVTIIAVFVQGGPTSNASENDCLRDDTIFCQGTGFAALSSANAPLLLTLLNVSEVPTMVVFDTSSGLPLSCLLYTSPSPRD